MLSDRWLKLSQPTESLDTAGQAMKASRPIEQNLSVPAPKSRPDAPAGDWRTNTTPPPAPVPEVRCSTCRHAQPATPGDPWSWHLCTAGADRAHGWGMAARRCGRWESRESHPPRRRAETIAP
ncbi:hypothetical protein E4P82_05655 [Candidatus Competibacter phosphatis]|uniref:Uncharacterized protein n=1 Tax=Candidatus Competibacter phosphatis TaxID=221280 RepID=A0ABX1TH80_9GAMM|nr:hypothetical protein [Candidatus Competibacter phosphatis]